MAAMIAAMLRVCTFRMVKKAYSSVVIFYSQLPLTFHVVHLWFSTPLSSKLLDSFFCDFSVLFHFFTLWLFFHSRNRISLSFREIKTYLLTKGSFHLVLRESVTYR